MSGSIPQAVSGDAREERPSASRLEFRPAAVKASLRPHGPVLGEALFRDALVRERRRADRFETAFAVLLIDRGDGRRERTFWVSILRTVRTVRRDIDVVGWFERNEVLGLLLPEAAARQSVEMLHALRREMAKQLGDRVSQAISVRLYAHGDHSRGEASGIPTVGLLLEAFLQPRRYPLDIAKRSLDIFGSLILVMLLAPLFIAVAALVRCTSSGPAIFRQVRIGRGGRPFTMLKFRSMHVHADDAIHRRYAISFIRSRGHATPVYGTEVYKITNDRRVTRVGHFLRRTSLDELPQFWNVLRGEMSLVGPRPPLAFEVEQYQPWHRRRVLEVKPGMTGLWQVSGRSRTTFDEMVRLDLRYARTRNLWTDIKILAATPRAVLSREGAW